MLIYKDGHVRNISDVMIDLLCLTPLSAIFNVRWFSPGTLASSTTKTGCHDIAEIFLKVALNTKNQNQIIYLLWKHII
jgi:hypothetical protein